MSRYIDEFLLKEKSAIIIGGTGLIGSEVSVALAAMGASAVILDIDGDKGKILTKRIIESGGEAVFIEFDISDHQNSKSIFTNLLKEYEKCNVLVNCAYPRTDDWNTIAEKFSYDSIRKNIEMQLSSAVWITNEAANHIKEHNHNGSIINLSSIYGIVSPDFSIYENTEMTCPMPYSAIKGGVISFTKYMASYYGRYGIRVNCVSPGGIYNSQPEEFVKKYIAKVPLKRMGNPEDIASAIIFLASDAATYITGQNIVIDGGLTSV